MKIFFNFYKQKNNYVNLKKSSIYANAKLYKKTTFIDINNSDIYKGLNTFVLKGQKLFIYSKLNNYFNLFYLYIYNNSSNKLNLKFSDFSYFYEIKSSINDNFFLNNPLNLLKWYLNYFSFMFNFKIANKQVKKNVKSTKNDINNNNNLKITFILKKKRNIFFFKWLKRLFFLNYSSNFFFTFCSLLNDVFFNFKNSNLYKYKLSIYKNLLSN